MRKNKINKIFLLTFLLIFSIFNCRLSSKPVDIKEVFKENIMEKTNKGYLQYGTYEMWEGFKEYVKYRFEFSGGGCSYDIDVDLLNANKETIEKEIDNEINTAKAKNFFFELKKRENIKINKNNAIIISYIYHGKNFKEKEITEYCYIFLDKNQTLKLRAYDTYVDYFEPGRSAWERLYKSFKTDFSGNYKTKFGSFQIDELTMKYMEGKKELPKFRDETKFEYSIKGPGDYWIEISYDDDLASIKKEYEEDPDRAFVKALKVDVETQRQELLVNSKDALSIKVDIIETTEIATKKISVLNKIWITGMYPYLMVKIKASDITLFERYKPQLGAFLKSIKFDK